MSTPGEEITRYFLAAGEEFSSLAASYVTEMLRQNHEFFCRSLGSPL